MINPILGDFLELLTKCTKIRILTEIFFQIAEILTIFIEKLSKSLQNRTKPGNSFLFNFDGFSQFVQFWLNLSAPTHQSGLQFGRPDFLKPLAPLGARQ